MAPVFKVANLSDRSNLSPVIVGYSSNMAKKRMGEWGSVLLLSNTGLRRFFFSQQKYQSIEL